MKYHYVWLVWSSAFLGPWIVLYVASPFLRAVMWRTSAATAMFGLTEPIFVPGYWNPPSLFELAQRTGFDIESLIFSLADQRYRTSTACSARIHARFSDPSYDGAARSPERRTESQRRSTRRGHHVTSDRRRKRGELTFGQCGRLAPPGD